MDDNSNNQPAMVYIEVAPSDGAFFDGSKKGDICIRAGNTTQAMLFGTGSNNKPTFSIDNSNMFVANAIGVGGTNDRTPLESFNVNTGNALFNSNIYVNGKIGVGTTTPTESLDIATGNAKINGNLQTLGSASIGLSPPIPTEVLDVGSNLKVQSNVYVMRRVSIASSNPTEALDVGGNLKVSQNIYSANNIVIGSSNPREMLDVASNTIVRSNLYVVRNVGIGTSNPTETLDVINRAKVRSDLYVIGSIGIGNSNFTEKFDLFGGNARMRCNLYVGCNASIGQNNITPTETLDVRGNAKITSNLYVLSNVAIGGSSNPTETLDVNGNIKTTNSLFAMNRIAVGTSNPIEKLHVEGTILASSNIYAFSNLGVGTTIPTERIDNVGNSKLRGDVYMLSKASVGHQTPMETLDVRGNEKVSSNLYVMQNVGVRTSNPLLPLHVIGNARIEGNLDVIGIANTISTDVQITDQFTVSNNGTGPALKVYQTGIEAIADFYDDDVLAMRITDGGNVGVNTDTPYEKVHVVGKVYTTQQFLSTANDSVTTPGYSFLENSNTGMFHPANNVLGFTTGGQERVRITQSGAIGVGTSTPTTSFDVIGNALFSNTLVTYNGTTTHSNDVIISGITTMSNALIVSSNIRSPTITSLSNTTHSLSNFVYTVGLGNTASAQISADFASNAGAFGSNTAVSSSNTATSLSNYVYTTISANVSATSAWSSNTATFASNTSVAASNRIFVSWSNNSSNLFIGIGSNIGIGVSNPSANLHIEDGIMFLGDRASGFNAVVPSLPGNCNVANGYRLYFDNSFNITPGSGMPANKIVIHNNNWTGGFGMEMDAVTYHSGANHTFYINAKNNAPTYGAIAMIISSNVGVGTSNPTSKLHVEGSSYIGGNLVMAATSNITVTSCNWIGGIFFNTTMPGGSNGGYYISRGGISSPDYRQHLVIHSDSTWSNSGVNFVTTGSVSRMFLDASNGNFGIGTLTPSYRLDVNGKIRATDNIVVANGRSFSFLRSNGVEQPFANIDNVNNVRIYTGCNNTVMYINSDFNANTEINYNNSNVTRIYYGTQAVFSVNNSNVGIGTTTPTSRLDVNSNATPTTTTASVNNTIATSTTVLNDPQTVLLLTRVGTLTQSWPAAARFSMCRYENAGTGSVGARTRLDIDLVHDINTTYTNIMSIRSDGRVGIGTTTPGALLEVSGTFRTFGGAVTFDCPSVGLSSTPTFNIDAPGVVGGRLTVLTNGNVGIGNATPSYLLDVNGTVNTSGSLRIQGGSNCINVANSDPGDMIVRNYGSSNRYGMGQYNNGATRIFAAAPVGWPSASVRIARVLGSVQDGNAAFDDFLTVLCSNGNVGIGTTTPTARLDVRGLVSITNSGATKLQVDNDTSTNRHIVLWDTSSNQHQFYGIGINGSMMRFQIDNTAACWAFYAGTSSTTSAEVLRIQGNGNVGIGTNSPSYPLHVNGQIYATNDVIAFSDKRLKYNLNIIDNALSKIHKLNGYTFNIKNDNKRKTGLIAQEVQEVLPEAVYQNDDGYYSLAYANMASLFVEALKELDNKYANKIQELENKINLLTTYSIS